MNPNSPDDIVSEVAVVFHPGCPSIFALAVHSSGNERSLVDIAADKVRHSFAGI